MDRAEAIKKLKSMRDSAIVVLDSGFGTHPGENNRIYRERKELAEFCLAALGEKETCEWCWHFQHNRQYLLSEGNGMYKEVIFTVCPVCARKFEEAE